MTFRDGGGHPGGRPDTAAELVDDDAGRLYGALFYRVHFTRHRVHALPLVFAPGAPRKPLVVRLLVQYLLGKLKNLKAVDLTLDVPEDDLPQQLLLRELGLKSTQVIPSADGTVYRFGYGKGVPQEEGVGVEE